MRTRLVALAVSFVGALAVSGAVAQTASQTSPQPAPRGGYLPAGAAPDTLKILPPPPAAKSTRQADDRAIFLATRALEGKPRWTLATEDADLKPAAGMFACALGVKLDAANAPTLAALMRKVAFDEGPVINPPKDHYARKRPYLVVPAPKTKGKSPKDGPAICVPKTDGLAKNGSYPSGHSTLSWSWGLLLAELAPDRATEILMRARAIGESRVVCGVHWASDVEIGRTNGAALVAVLHGDAAFRAGMDKARAEIATARQATHPAPQNCAVQNEAAAHPPY